MDNINSNWYAYAVFFKSFKNSKLQKFARYIISEESVIR